VQNGESIQSAIASAPAGSQIMVAAGVYEEQLTITTDGITLVGHGAILVPPASPMSNECSGLAGPDTEAGICIIGSQVELADFEVEHRKILSVGKRVMNVAVTGFDVRGFSGLNIVVVGGQGAMIMGNHLMDGAQYGVLSLGSLDSTIEGNDVTGNLSFIGICMDDNLGGGTKVHKNSIFGYIIGLCVETDHAQVMANDVSGCCIGANVDANVTGAQVTGNHFGAVDPRCTVGPMATAYGILLTASVGTTVSGNVVEGMRVEGGSNGTVSGGIAIFDDIFTGTDAVANDNVVTGNVLKNNDNDIVVMTNGTGNVIEGNVCTTPAQYCGSPGV